MITDKPIAMITWTNKTHWQIEDYFAGFHSPQVSQLIGVHPRCNKADPEQIQEYKYQCRTCGYFQHFPGEEEFHSLVVELIRKPVPPQNV